MKKGKTSKLNIFDDAKCHYGTVDSKNLKSVYLNLQSWVNPKDEYENWVRIVGNLSRDIKHSVYESLNGELFHENFIVDLDLRTSGIQVGKKSFMNLEINLFTKNELDFKSTIVKDSVKKIIKEIYKNCIIRNTKFLFSSSKNPISEKTFL